MQTIVSKAEFAAMKGRGASAVSNWIADGKITAAALVGTGVRARIWVEQAERDLARNLDPSQQIAQDQPIGLTAPAAPVAPMEVAPVAAAPVPAPAPPPAVEDEDLRRRRRADADAAERNAELTRLKLEREAGRWVDAAEAQRRFGREMTEQMVQVETWLQQRLARRLAEAHGLDWRAVSTDIRKAWRDYRGGVADAAEDAPGGGTDRDDDGGGAAAALM